MCACLSVRVLSFAHSHAVSHYHDALAPHRSADTRAERTESNAGSVVLKPRDLLTFVVDLAKPSY